MKTQLSTLLFTLALLSTLNSPLSTAHAQGTAFTYQGRLNDGANPANGNYDLKFTLFGVNSGGSAVAGPFTNSPTGVTNGLFTVTLDFGNQFPGAPRWLEIAVRTNGSGAFSTLALRQQLTPTPYAITASNLTGFLPAAQLSGTVGNSQLANNSVTVSAGTGLSGGGPAALGGSTTLNNAGVLSVTGNGDITANTAGGAVTLGTTATSANTASTLVKRDAVGSFSAGSVTLSGNLNLPYPATISSGGSTILVENGSFFAGLNAGLGATANAFDVGVGDNVLSSGDTGGVNTAIGGGALLSNTTGNDNTAVGNAALESNTTGTQNTAIGEESLRSNTTGSINTASGREAMLSNTTGVGNTASGYEALRFNTTGSDNTASGSTALLSNTTGGNNTATGNGAMEYNTTGFYNTATGDGALFFNTNGYFNTATGAGVMQSNTSGHDNTADGYFALFRNTAGSLNIALGDEAGQNITNGDYNIDIGNDGAAADHNIIRIGTQGNQTSTFMAGIFGTTVSGSAVTVNSSGQLGVAPSSQRFKQDIHSMGDESAALLALRPVAFRYKPGIDPKGTPQFGLVAEEVDKVDPDLVTRDNKNKIFTVRYEAINAMLLNEFLKEHKTVQKQNTEIQDLKQSVEELKKLVQSLSEKK